MRKGKDEITLKEAAELVESSLVDRQKFLREWDEDTDEIAAREKRRREVGNAGATLDVMLSASRHGKIVRGKP